MTKERALSVGQSEPRSLTAGSAIDLSGLCDMHPRLPAEMAALMVIRAALGLQRNKHTSGTDIQLAIERVGLRCVLRWPHADMDMAKQHDRNRVTEDGAEAIALAVAHKNSAWRVVRRMQREEHADWLLEHQDNGVRKLVAFEVSGVDEGSIAGRVRAKLDQVAESVDVDHRWAGVVGFEKPEAALQSVEGRTHGR